MQFYEELMKKIEDLIDCEKIEEAYNLITNELSMPYIPKEYEERLHFLLNEVRGELNQHSKLSYEHYDEHQLLNLLNSNNIEEAFKAVEYLKTSNVRMYLDVIEVYLSNNPDPNIRGSLVYLLAQQQVNEAIKLDYDGLEVEFIASYVDLAEESEGFVMCEKLLDEWLENDNPSMLKMAREILALEYYYRVPFSLDVDEAMVVCKGIIKYISELSDDLITYNQVVEEKKLANIGDYDLLLYKYK